MLRSITLAVLIFVSGAIGWCLAGMTDNWRTVVSFPQICVLGVSLLVLIVLCGVVMAQSTKVEIKAADADAMLKAYPCRDCPRRPTGNDSNE